MTFIEDISEHEKDFWSKRHKISKALERGHDPLTLDEVVRALDNGEAQYWYSKDSCLITTIAQRGDCRILSVWLGAGELNECLELHDMVEDFAREMECDRIEISGRDWSRVLASRGYRRIRVTICKDL